MLLSFWFWLPWWIIFNFLAISSCIYRHTFQQSPSVLQVLAGSEHTCYLHGMVTWPVLWESFLLEWSVFPERNPSISWLYGISLVANILPGDLAVFTNWINFDTCCLQKFSVRKLIYVYFNNDEEQHTVMHILIY